ncbi:MAG: hypothetical protein IIA66_12835, partial [Planctomycetes bacterium]|nr:hypothetical protein [Planctomycetota bacterium]
GSGIAGCQGKHCWPTVTGLAVYNGELIAGGYFTTAGGMEANAIARWDGTNWSPMAGEMNTYVYIYALTVYSGELIAGGWFTSAGGMPAARIARWDGTTWSPLGSGMNDTVLALNEYNGELIAGGEFTTAGGQVSAYWARWGSDAPLGDLDGNCNVGPFDLALLLGNWGPCADCDDCPADLNGDCDVGAFDLAILLGNWG